MNRKLKALGDFRFLRSSQNVTDKGRPGVWQCQFLGVVWHD